MRAMLVLQSGEENLCSDLVAAIGLTAQGGLAEPVVVPLNRLFVVPENVDPYKPSR